LEAAIEKESDKFSWASLEIGGKFAPNVAVGSRAVSSLVAPNAAQAQADAVKAGENDPGDD
jgi:hypothetical protein